MTTPAPGNAPPDGAAGAAGLTHAQARARLSRDGANELPLPRHRVVLDGLLLLAREPMFILLVVAGSIYALVGELAEAAMLLLFVLITLVLTFTQHRRTARVLETLRDLSSPRALVLREGNLVRVAGREVVADDLLVFSEGDRIAADGVITQSRDLWLDESLLTGESLPILKSGQAPDHQVFSGTMVVRGQGTARVTATGPATAVGRIGKVAAAARAPDSPMQREVRSLVWRFGALGLACALLAALLMMASGVGWTRGMLTGLALAMSLLPEEFAVVLTVFLALGAWRIARSQVLTRSPPVIEALDAMTVLCVDKTGTLTSNRMVLVAQVPAADGLGQAVPPTELLRTAVLACSARPHDPMEQALLDAMPPPAAPQTPQVLLHVYPISPQWMAMAQVWQIGAHSVVACKGAPEAVARLCGLEPERRQQVLAEAEQLASKGIRVLAVASGSCAGPPWPDRMDALALSWMGLVGMADPLRPGVAAAVAECHQAGIKVVMITGDHPGTALAIAAQAGLRGERVVTGAQLDARQEQPDMPDLISATTVFARVRAEQKLLLVAALQSAGEVVAMTGDGVNDAPALQAADIGISMGARGTDVAREASDLVLLNDDFNAIVAAVRLGRRIHDNLRKAIIYVVAVHVPIAGMVLLPLLVGAAPVFTPVHIAFLEIIINPACALVFEADPAAPDIMSRPPRSKAERLLDRRHFTMACLQGFGCLACVGTLFVGAIERGIPPDVARAMAFIAVVLGNLGLIASNRSLAQGLLHILAQPNRSQWLIMGAALLALAATLGVAPLRAVFYFGLPSGPGVAAAALAGLAAMAWFELVKAVYRRRPKGAPLQRFSGQA